MDILAKILGGTGLLIALYLVLTNPKGDTSLLSSGKGAYVAGVEALQGR